MHLEKCPSAAVAVVAARSQDNGTLQFLWIPAGILYSAIHCFKLAVCIAAPDFPKIRAFTLESGGNVVGRNGRIAGPDFDPAAASTPATRPFSHVIHDPGAFAGAMAPFVKVPNDRLHGCVAVVRVAGLGVSVVEATP